MKREIPCHDLTNSRSVSGLHGTGSNATAVGMQRGPVEVAQMPLWKDVVIGVGTAIRRLWRGEH